MDKIRTVKRGRPPGRTYADPIPVRFTPVQIKAINAWRQGEPEPLSTADAIRELVMAGLAVKLRERRQAARRAPSEAA